MQTTMNITKREEQFLNLLRPIHHRAERFALTLAHNRDDAKDLLQDAIVVVWQHFDDIRDTAAFRTYLFTVMSNLNKRQYKRRTKEVGFEDGAEHAIESNEPSSETRVEALIVREAINKLPAKARDAILLYEVHDLSLAEIAIIQQCSLSAVKVRLMRARHALARKLGVTDDITPVVSPTPTVQ